MIAVAIFLTYSLQFYVPMEIIWKNVQHNFNEHKNAAEYGIRIGLVVSSLRCSLNDMKQSCINLVMNDALSKNKNAYNKNFMYGLF